MLKFDFLLVFPGLLFCILVIAHNLNDCYYMRRHRNP